ncbi:hypothetical protein [Vibrio chagasii]|uniref:hypothetical protein n=1 Tax=Vibrio chagasii TaxID=170679 RepID=UPI00373502AE
MKKVAYAAFFAFKKQMRVYEIRKTKKAEQNGIVLLLVFSLLSFSHLDYPNPASALKLFDTRLPESRIRS